MALAFLDRDRSIAPAGYSRWLVPPAALAIHLAIEAPVQFYALVYVPARAPMDLFAREVLPKFSAVPLPA